MRFNTVGEKTAKAVRELRISQNLADVRTHALVALDEGLKGLLLGIDLGEFLARGGFVRPQLRKPRLESLNIGLELFGCLARLACIVCRGFKKRLGRGFFFSQLRALGFAPADLRGNPACLPGKRIHLRFQPMDLL